MDAAVNAADAVELRERFNEPIPLLNEQLGAAGLATLQMVTTGVLEREMYPS